MRFNTHDRTPRPKTSTLVKALFLISGGLLAVLLSFFAVYASITVKSVAPAVLVLPLPLLAILNLLTISDMKKAYVETTGDSITAVDHYFGVKKEKMIPKQEVFSTEILPGGAWRTRGLGFPLFNYIVFRDREGKYLCKVFYTPETMQYFEQYLKQSEENQA